MERKRIDDEAVRLAVARTPSGAAVMRPEVTRALTRALFAEWADRGFAALSLEAVAKRAGVGKAALYRRWPSKSAMVVDRIEAVGLDLTDIPDQGSLVADVRAFLVALRRVLRHPLVRRIVPDLHAELPRSAELRGLVRPFQSARRARGETLLRRAIARGELPPDLDTALANDLLAAPLYWRMIVTGEQAGSHYLDSLTSTIVAGLRGAQRAPVADER